MDNNIYDDIDAIIRDEEDLENYIENVSTMNYNIKNALSRSNTPDMAAEEVFNLLCKNRDDMEAQGLPGEAIEDLINYHIDAYIAMLIALDREDIARAFLYRSKDKAQYEEGV